jgi:phosphoglycolate phosphatase
VDPAVVGGTVTRRVALFDLDGTLSESEPGIVGCLATALAAVGVSVPPVEVLRLAIGPPFETALPDIGVPVAAVPTVIAAYRERYEAGGLFETRLYDGIIEMLDALDAFGVALALATSKPQRTAERVLAHLGLSDRFRAVAGATYDASRRTKGAVIGHALGALGVGAGPHVVMVGDRHHDIDGAREHGIDTIAVGWGYGDADEHRAADAWARAEHPAEVVALVTASPAAPR